MYYLPISTSYDAVDSDGNPVTITAVATFIPQPSELEPKPIQQSVINFVTFKWQFADIDNNVCSSPHASYCSCAIPDEDKALVLAVINGNNWVRSLNPEDGTPVYDNDGNIIGVLDSYGNIIGQVVLTGITQDDIDRVAQICFASNEAIAALPFRT
jgi:hypothetical protein